MIMSEKILEVKHLGKAFGSNQVLRDIDFSVSPGDVTCIIGPSGSGKIHASSLPEYAGNSIHRRNQLSWN